MNRPLFEVGEVVILQSKSLPEMSGEYTVMAFLVPGDIYFDPVAGQRVRRLGAGGYVLDCPASLPLSDGSPGARIWAESALRKRHQPGEHTFGGLMASLNAPVSRDQLARLDREVAHG